jgi:hypothetical protein
MLLAGGVMSRCRAVGGRGDLGPDSAISGTQLIKISNKHAAEDAVFDVVRSGRAHSLMVARNEGMPHA